ncbi:MAG: diguanylate cyclase [Nitrospirota bacterium]|nr:diguanylate cyclase [Nitrospirota bacterium]
MTSGQPSPFTGRITRSQPLRIALIGGGVEALEWVPLLFRESHVDLVAVVATHPADLLLNLDDHGYELADPSPLRVLREVAELAREPLPDLLVDTTLSPLVPRQLAEAGLGDVPRVNSGGLRLLLERPPGAAPTHLARVDVVRKLTQEVGRAYRHGRTLGVLLVQLRDADGGTPDGDIMDGACRRIEQSLRLEDTVTRDGDGTVVVVLPETGDTTRQVVRRLTSDLADFRIHPGATASALAHAVGWAWFPQDAKSAPALLEQAKARLNAPQSRKHQGARGTSDGPN